MSQSFWDTEPQAEQASSHPELLEPEEPEMLEPEAEPGEPGESGDPEEPELSAAIEEPEVRFEPPALEKAPAPLPVKSGEVLAMSVDEFTALEERVLRAVNLVKRERLARAEADTRAAAAEARATQLEAQLAEQAPKVDQLQAEIHTLRTERDQVRQRVERLLSQLDALEL
jgi:uncharacterized coiled-coil protein SlyX